MPQDARPRCHFAYQSNCRRFLTKVKSRASLQASWRTPKCECTPKACPLMLLPQAPLWWLSPYPEDLATSRAPWTGDVRSEAQGLSKCHLPGVWYVWAAPVLMWWWMAELTKTHCSVLFLCVDTVVVQCKGRPLSPKQPAAICALPGQPCYIELRASSHWHK